MDNPDDSDGASRSPLAHSTRVGPRVDPTRAHPPHDATKENNQDLQMTTGFKHRRAEDSEMDKYAESDINSGSEILDESADEAYDSQDFSSLVSEDEPRVVSKKAVTDPDPFMTSHPEWLDSGILRDVSADDIPDTGFDQYSPVNAKIAQTKTNTKVGVGAENVFRDNKKTTQPEKTRTAVHDGQQTREDHEVLSFDRVFANPDTFATTDTGDAKCVPAFTDSIDYKATSAVKENDSREENEMTDTATRRVSETGQQEDETENVIRKARHHKDVESETERNTNVVETFDSEGKMIDSGLVAAENIHEMKREDDSEFVEKLRTVEADGELIAASSMTELNEMDREEDTQKERFVMEDDVSMLDVDKMDKTETCHKRTHKETVDSKKGEDGSMVESTGISDHKENMESQQSESHVIDKKLGKKGGVDSVSDMKSSCTESKSEVADYEEQNSGNDNGSKRSKRSHQKKSSHQESSSKSSSSSRRSGESSESVADLTGRNKPCSLIPGSISLDKFGTNMPCLARKGLLGENLSAGEGPGRSRSPLQHRMSPVLPGVLKGAGAHSIPRDVFECEPMEQIPELKRKLDIESSPAFGLISKDTNKSPSPVRKAAKKVEFNQMAEVLDSDDERYDQLLRMTSTESDDSCVEDCGEDHNAIIQATSPQSGEQVCEEGHYHRSVGSILNDNTDPAEDGGSSTLCKVGSGSEGISNPYGTGSAKSNHSRNDKGSDVIVAIATPTRSRNWDTASNCDPDFIRQKGGFDSNLPWNAPITRGDKGKHTSLSKDKQKGSVVHLDTDSKCVAAPETCNINRLPADADVDGEKVNIAGKTGHVCPVKSSGFGDKVVGIERCLGSEGDMGSYESTADLYTIPVGAIAGQVGGTGSCGTILPPGESSMKHKRLEIDHDVPVQDACHKREGAVAGEASHSFEIQGAQLGSGSLSNKSRSTFSTGIDSRPFLSGSRDAAEGSCGEEGSSGSVVPGDGSWETGSAQARSVTSHSPSFVGTGSRGLSPGSPTPTLQAGYGRLATGNNQLGSEQFRTLASMNETTKLSEFRGNSDRAFIDPDPDPAAESKQVPCSGLREIISDPLIPSPPTQRGGTIIAGYDTTQVGVIMEKLYHGSGLGLGENVREGGSGGIIGPDGRRVGSITLPTTLDWSADPDGYPKSGLCKAEGAALVRSLPVEIGGGNSSSTRVAHEGTEAGVQLASAGNAERLIGASKKLLLSLKEHQNPGRKKMENCPLKGSGEHEKIEAVCEGVGGEGGIEGGADSGGRRAAGIVHSSRDVQHLDSGPVHHTDLILGSAPPRPPCGLLPITSGAAKHSDAGSVPTSPGSGETSYPRPALPPSPGLPSLPHPSSSGTTSSNQGSLPQHLYSVPHQLRELSHELYLSSSPFSSASSLASSATDIEPPREQNAGLAAKCAHGSVRESTEATAADFAPITSQTQQHLDSHRNQPEGFSSKRIHGDEGCTGSDPDFELDYAKDSIALFTSDQSEIVCNTGERSTDSQSSQGQDKGQPDCVRVTSGQSGSNTYLTEQSADPDIGRGDHLDTSLLSEDDVIGLINREASSAGHIQLDSGSITSVQTNDSELSTESQDELESTSDLGQNWPTELCASSILSGSDPDDSADTQKKRGCKIGYPGDQLHKEGEQGERVTCERELKTENTADQTGTAPFSVAISQKPSVDHFHWQTVNVPGNHPSAAQPIVSDHSPEATCTGLDSAAAVTDKGGSDEGREATFYVEPVTFDTPPITPNEVDCPSHQPQSAPVSGYSAVSHITQSQREEEHRRSILSSKSSASEIPHDNTSIFKSAAPPTIGVSGPVLSTQSSGLSVLDSGGHDIHDATMDKSQANGGDLQAARDGSSTPSASSSVDTDEEFVVLDGVQVAEPRQLSGSACVALGADLKRDDVVLRPEELIFREARDLHMEDVTKQQCVDSGMETESSLNVNKGDEAAAGAGAAQERDGHEDGRDVQLEGDDISGMDDYDICDISDVLGDEEVDSDGDANSETCDSADTFIILDDNIEQPDLFRQLEHLDEESDSGEQDMHEHDTVAGAGGHGSPAGSREVNECGAASAAERDVLGTGDSGAPLTRADTGERDGGKHTAASSAISTDGLQQALVESIAADERAASAVIGAITDEVCTLNADLNSRPEPDAPSGLVSAKLDDSAPGYSRPSESMGGVVSDPSAQPQQQGEDEEANLSGSELDYRQYIIMEQEYEEEEEGCSVEAQAVDMSETSDPIEKLGVLYADSSNNEEVVGYKRESSQKLNSPSSKDEDVGVINSARPAGGKEARGGKDEGREHLDTDTPHRARGLPEAAGDGVRGGAGGQYDKEDESRRDRLQGDGTREAGLADRVDTAPYLVAAAAAVDVHVETGASTVEGGQWGETASAAPRYTPPSPPQDYRDESRPTPHKQTPGQQGDIEIIDTKVSQAAREYSDIPVPETQQTSQQPDQTGSDVLSATSDTDVTTASPSMMTSSMETTDSVVSATVAMDTGYESVTTDATKVTETTTEECHRSYTSMSDPYTEPVPVGAKSVPNIVEMVAKEEVHMSAFERRRKRARSEGEVEARKRFSKQDVDDAVQKLKQGSAGGRGRSHSQYVRGSRRRQYDWNTYHFFPDSHPYDYTPSHRRSTEAIYSQYVEEEWIRDLESYNHQLREEQERLEHEMLVKKELQMKQELTSSTSTKMDVENIENIPPKIVELEASPRVGRSFQISTKQERSVHQETRSDLAGSSSSSGDESPKIWRKSPLHVRRKKRSERPMSAEIRYTSDQSEPDRPIKKPSPSVKRKEESPRTRRSPRRLSEPLGPKKPTSGSRSPRQNSDLIQEKLQQFQELQRRRQALQSTSEESLAKGENDKKQPRHTQEDIHFEQKYLSEKIERRNSGRQYKQETRYSPKVVKRYQISPRATRKETGEQCSTRSEQEAKSQYDMQHQEGRTVESIRNESFYEPASVEEKKLEDYRNLSSSFENIYDGVDLSMYNTSIHEIDLSEYLKRSPQTSPQKESKNTSSKHPELYLDIRRPHAPASSGTKTVKDQYDLTRQEAHDKAKVSVSRQFSGDAATISEGSLRSPHSPVWYVPKSSEHYEDTAEAKLAAKKFDAKALMAEEQQKFEAYKKEYVRRLSERDSTSGTSGDERGKEGQEQEQDAPHRVIPPDDYEYILRKIHHKRQDAFYDESTSGESGGWIPSDGSAKQHSGSGEHSSPPVTSQRDCQHIRGEKPSSMSPSLYAQYLQVSTAQHERSISQLSTESSRELEQYFRDAPKEKTAKPPSQLATVPSESPKESQKPESLSHSHSPVCSQTVSPKPSSTQQYQFQPEKSKIQPRYDLESSQQEPRYTKHSYKSREPPKSPERSPAQKDEQHQEATDTTELLSVREQILALEKLGKPDQEDVGYEASATIEKLKMKRIENLKKSEMFMRQKEEKNIRLQDDTKESPSVEDNGIPGKPPMSPSHAVSNVSWQYNTVFEPTTPPGTDNAPPSPQWPSRKVEKTEDPKEQSQKVPAINEPPKSQIENKMSEGRTFVVTRHWSKDPRRQPWLDSSLESEFPPMLDRLTPTPSEEFGSRRTQPVPLQHTRSHDNLYMPDHPQRGNDSRLNPRVYASDRPRHGRPEHKKQEPFQQRPDERRMQAKNKEPSQRPDKNQPQDRYLREKPLEDNRYFSHHDKPRHISLERSDQQEQHQPRSRSNDAATQMHKTMSLPHDQWAMIPTSDQRTAQDKQNWARDVNTAKWDSGKNVERRHHSLRGERPSSTEVNFPESAQYGTYYTKDSRGQLSPVYQEKRVSERRLSLERERLAQAKSWTHRIEEVESMRPPSEHSQRKDRPPSEQSLRKERPHSEQSFRKERPSDQPSRKDSTGSQPNIHKPAMDLGKPIYISHSSTKVNQNLPFKSYDEKVQTYCDEQKHSTATDQYEEHIKRKQEKYRSQSSIDSQKEQSDYVDPTTIRQRKFSDDAFLSEELRRPVSGEWNDDQKSAGHSIIERAQAAPSQIAPSTKTRVVADYKSDQKVKDVMSAPTAPSPDPNSFVVQVQLHKVPQRSSSPDLGKKLGRAFQVCMTKSHEDLTSILPKEEERANVNDIKDKLFGTEGEKSGGLPFLKELQQLWDRRDRKVSAIKSDRFSNQDEALPRYRSMSSAQHLDDQDDTRISNYVSYKDGQMRKKSNIVDELTDLERAYEKLNFQEEQFDAGHRVVRAYSTSSAPAGDDDFAPNVKRLSITNLKKLEDMQRQVESRDYTQTWLTSGRMRARSEGEDEVFTRQAGDPPPLPKTEPPAHLPPPQPTQEFYSSYSINQSESDASYGTRPTARSSYPRKVKDDMAYRRQRPNTGSTVNGRVDYPPSASMSYLGHSPTISPSQSMDSLARSKASGHARVPDPYFDDMAYRQRLRGKSPGAGCDVDSSMIRPSPTSTDYLNPRTTEPARGRLRIRPEKHADIYHDDYAYRQLRKDVEPVRAELPQRYYERTSTEIHQHHQHRSRSLERVQQENRRPDEQNNDGQQVKRSRSFGPSQEKPLAEGVAKMVSHFSHPVTYTQSAPDLTDKGTFSGNYNSSGDLVTEDPRYSKHAAKPKLPKQQTPRTVKLRHELKSKMKQMKVSADSGYMELSESDASYSSGQEPNRSPPEGFDSDEPDIRMSDTRLDYSVNTHSVHQYGQQSVPPLADLHAELNQRLPYQYAEPVTQRSDAPSSHLDNNNRNNNNMYGKTREIPIHYTHKSFNQAPASSYEVQKPTSQTETRAHPTSDSPEFCWMVKGQGSQAKVVKEQILHDRVRASSVEHQQPGKEKPVVKEVEALKSNVETTDNSVSIDNRIPFIDQDSTSSGSPDVRLTHQDLYITKSATLETEILTASERKQREMLQQKDREEDIEKQVKLEFSFKAPESGSGNINLDSPQSPGQKMKVESPQSLRKRFQHNRESRQRVIDAKLAGKDQSVEHQVSSPIVVPVRQETEVEPKQAVEVKTVPEPIKIQPKIPTHLALKHARKAFFSDMSKIKDAPKKPERSSSLPRTAHRGQPEKTEVSKSELLMKLSKDAESMPVAKAVPGERRFAAYLNKRTTDKKVDVPEEPKRQAPVAPPASSTKSLPANIQYGKRIPSSSTEVNSKEISSPKNFCPGKIAAAVLSAHKSPSPSPGRGQESCGRTDSGTTSPGSKPPTVTVTKYEGRLQAAQRGGPDKDPQTAAVVERQVVTKKNIHSVRSIKISSTSQVVQPMTVRSEVGDDGRLLSPPPEKARTPTQPGPRLSPAERGFLSPPPRRAGMSPSSFELSDGEMTDATDITLDGLVGANTGRPSSPETLGFSDYCDNDENRAHIDSSSDSSSENSQKEYVVSQSGATRGRQPTRVSKFVHRTIASSSSTTVTQSGQSETSSQVTNQSQRFSQTMMTSSDHQGPAPIAEVEEEQDDEVSFKDLIKSFESKASPFMRAGRTPSQTSLDKV